MFEGFCLNRSRVALLQDVDDVFKEVQNSAIKPRLQEEQTLEDIVKAFNGDDRYLASGCRMLDDRGMGVMI